MKDNPEALRRVENAERELALARRALEGPPVPERLRLETAVAGNEIVVRVDKTQPPWVAIDSIGRPGRLEVRSITPPQARQIAAKLIECADWLEAKA